MKRTIALQAARRMREMLRDADIFDGRCYIGRGWSLSEGVLPAADVSPLEADVSPMGGTGVEKHDLTVALDVYAREGVDVSALEVADPYLVRADAVMLEDSTLGDLVARIVPAGLRWDTQTGNGGIAQVRRLYRVIYASRVGDLSTPPQ